MMRKCLLFLFAVASCVLASGQNAGSVSSAELAYSVILDKDISCDNACSHWWANNLEYRSNEALFGKLIERIKKGEIKVFFPEAPFTKEMSLRDVDLVMFKRDTMQVFTTGSDMTEKVISDPREPKNLGYITFYEDWKFDEGTMAFQKKVKGILLKAFQHQSYGTGIQQVALFYIPMNDLANQSEAGLVHIPGLLTTVWPYAELATEKEYSENNVKRELLLRKMAGVAIRKPELLRGTAFPFDAKPDAKEIKNISSRLEAANGMDFLEDWDVDNKGLPGFQKKVKGILFYQETKKMKIVGYGDTLTRIPIAFLPLNGFLPVPISFEKTCSVSKIATFCQFMKDTSASFNPERIRCTDIEKVTSPGVFLAGSAWKGKMKSYGLQQYDNSGLWGSGKVPLTNRELDFVFVRTDTIMVVLTPGNPPVDKVLRDTLDLHGISAYTFYESWKFEPTTGRFEKKVQGMGLGYLKENGGAKGVGGLLAVDLQPVADPALIVQEQYLVGKDIKMRVPILQLEDNVNPNPEYRSYGELTNYEGTTNYIYPSERFALIQSLLNDVKENKLQAWSPADLKQQHALTKPEILAALAKFNEAAKDVSAQDFTSEYRAVRELIFIEDWYFNPITTQFYKRVKQVTLSKRGNEVPEAPDQELFTIGLK